MPIVSIINYGVGNLRSVKKGLERAGAKVRITCSPRGIRESDAVVLPGVGAFSIAINNLNSLTSALRQFVEECKPILGICLGLQLLFTKSNEGGSIDGLDIISGNVVKLPESVKIPQIGWNTVKFVKPHPLLEGIHDNSFFYFVHSYIPLPLEKEVVIATTDYGKKFPSIVAKRNILATQFHPEKSSKTGLILLKNFVKEARS